MKRITTALLISCMTVFVAFSNIQAKDIELLGAGATFPYPLYSKQFDAYSQQSRVRINYQAIGSGGGIQQLLSKTVDFGGSDAFMSDQELEKVAGRILHVPTCLGAVVVTYNLPNRPTLQFTPDVIADIFLGELTKWNDPRIASINPSVHLPDMNIVVVHRSDGSGTTFIFSDYLSKVNMKWKDSVGAGKSLNWPAGLGAKGNPGVAGLIQQLPGAIGYIELIYALQNNMPVGPVQNKAGRFVLPSIESVSRAADTELPVDTRVSITDTDAADGYPISGFTWLILYQEQNYNNRPREKANALVQLLWWLIHEGQEYAEPLQYAPLSKESQKKAEDILRSVVFDGKPILKELQ